LQGADTVQELCSKRRMLHHCAGTAQGGPRGKAVPGSHFFFFGASNRARRTVPRLRRCKQHQGGALCVHRARASTDMIEFPGTCTRPRFADGSWANPLPRSTEAGSYRCLRPTSRPRQAHVLGRRPSWRPANRLRWQAMARTGRAATEEDGLRDSGSPSGTRGRERSPRLEFAVTRKRPGGAR